MTTLRILLASILLAACCPDAPPDGTGGAGGTIDTLTSTGRATGGADGGSCLCDCPDGPPPDGQISAFCQDPANNCTADSCPPCCLGGGNVGMCADLECVVPE